MNLNRSTPAPVLSFAPGTQVTWRAPSPEDGSNEIGTVVEDGRPFVLVQFGSDEPNTVNAGHLRAVEPMRQQPEQQRQAADSPVQIAHPMDRDPFAGIEESTEWEATQPAVGLVRPSAGQQPVFRSDREADAVIGILIGLAGME